jgi:VanZ family protein
MVSARHRSSAAPLAWLYAGLVVYASLYPFTGWSASVAPIWAFLSADWPWWWGRFDLISNVLGYVPLGVLVFGALVRTGWRVLSAVVLAFVTGSLLSLSMEFLQNFLPTRVPSNLDLATNALGTALGALTGLVLHLLGMVERWQRLRERWFIERSAGGLALLLLWPVGLLFPLPTPLGMGQVLERLRNWLQLMIEGSWLEPWLFDWLQVQAVLEPLTPGNELTVIALGLLAPCGIAFAITRSRVYRLIGLAVMGAVGFGITTLSTAMNFGPEHALAWLTPSALPAWSFGMLLGALSCWFPRRVSAALGLMVLAALVALVEQAPSDPYFAQSLQAWEQGRFIHFHGAAQWVGWLWPYSAMLYLVVRLASVEENQAQALKSQITSL